MNINIIVPNKPYLTKRVVFLNINVEGCESMCMNIDLTDKLDLSHKDEKYIELEIAGKKIKIPDWINLKAGINYEKSFKENNNYRKAFCNLVFTMINSDQDDKSVKLEDVENLSDSDLIKIIQLYIKSQEMLNKCFNNNFNNDYFKTFYLAIKEEENEAAKLASKSLGIMGDNIRNSLKPLIAGLGNMQKLTIPLIKDNNNSFKSFEDIQEKKNPLNYDALIGKGIYGFKPAPIITNELLKKLNSNIEDQKNIQQDYQIQNNENMKQMIELLAKEQESRERLEKETKIADKRNFKINITIVILTALALIATIAGIVITMIG